jgi:protein ImuA
MSDKQDILNGLRKQILLLEGFKEPVLTEDTSLGRINEAFPNGVFPFSALHEFFCFNGEEVAASSAFIAGLLSSRVSKVCTVVWIGSAPKVFPPSLKWFGIEPHCVVFLHIKKEKDIPWAINEALTCSSLSAVVAEMPGMSITASRRFQLAIENAGVGCFILRRNPKNLLTTAVSRWHIQTLPTITEDKLPGLGHPRWKVDLLKVRNGKTASWNIEWTSNGFRYPSRLAVINNSLHKQIG